jgi:hypothetical protein
LETLPSNARIIPGDYVVLLSSKVDNIDQWIVTLNEDHLSSTMNIRYVYNQSIVPSTLLGNVETAIHGVALSNVSNVELQGLLDSELVTAITPVRLDSTSIRFLHYIRLCFCFSYFFRLQPIDRIHFFGYTFTHSVSHPTRQLL